MHLITTSEKQKIDEKIKSGDLNVYEKRFLTFTQLMRREVMLRNAKITHK